MKIYTNKIPNYIINVLTTFLFFIFISLNTASWGKYAMLAISFVICAISASSYCGGVKFTVKPFHIFLFVFAVYCGISSFWAIGPKDSLTDCKIIFSILGCFSLIYMHYQKEDNTSTLINILKYGGLLMAIYTIFYYGFNNIIAGIQGDRIGTTFANTNNVGMVAAFTCLLQFYDILCKKNIILNILFFIITLIVLLATQSRTAIICLILGIILLSYLKSTDKKNFLKALKNFVLFSLVFIFLLYIIPKFYSEYGFIERINGLFSAINGDNRNADHSAQVRLQLINIGWEAFKKHPILGVGMKNGHYIAQEKINFKGFFHNNYIEILCGGGIIGLFIYYSIYVYLFYMLIKYRANNYDVFFICITCLVIMLLMDYGSVTYYTKQQYFYLMIISLLIDQLKTIKSGTR